MAAIAALVILYGLLSARLGRWSISGPLVFTACGVALGPTGLDLIGGQFDEGAVELLAEATLVLILFADATRIDLRLLRHQALLPARLLGLALPATLVLGAVLAWLLFEELGIWEAALCAAVLTPTDAALGQAVVSNPRVPIRIRQALNVESGLNDGLMLPVITVLVALAARGEELGSTSHWAAFAARQIGFGLLAGIVAGTVGGWALDAAARRHWVEGAMRQLATLAVAVVAFGGAELVEGNGFVAAFVAGVVFGYVAGAQCEGAADFTEDEGQLLALLTFLYFGALLLGPRLDRLTPSIALYALASLTVIRMGPTALALLGAGLERPSLGYVGWFGPRGLASILFALLVVEEADLGGAEVIVDVMSWTVAASIVAHGLSSVPLAERYGDWFQSMDDAESMPEGEPVAEMRNRL